ncbi:hypothetical protein [Chryseobacterium sp. GP-SGM7]|uniref:hypothetical protein n=1 Tax=Chryseobacterium sp. GP-SGM7 TaxID=3411323 RepID=UPI003B92CCD0
MKDQIPVFTAEIIKIEAINPDNVKYDKIKVLSLGIFEIKPSETKKIKFGINVTLHKDLITLDIK